MSEKTNRSVWLARRIEGWQLSSAKCVTGITVFLTVTGLAIYLLPFSVFNQHGVLVHTAVGMLFLAPLLWYLVKHIRAYWEYPFSHLKFSGYCSGVVMIACCFSGVVLTWESAFGTRISELWRMVHIVTTFVLLVLLTAHLVPLMLRARKASVLAHSGELPGAIRAHMTRATGWTAVCLFGTVLLSVLVRPVTFANTFPEEYDQNAYGDKGPFAPSLATTSTGGAFDAISLAGSASCGTSGCHEEIYQEWLPSAHRYASQDAGFQAIQSVMAEQNGPNSTRYCAGCHDPISLFSGTKYIGVEDLTGLDGYNEGISCLACHAIRQTDVAGNANYVMEQPERYVWELREGGVAKFLADFTIRAYPKKHIDSLSHRMFKTPEFCAACHKQFIDKEVNKVGWVQLQNQYDNWKASRWHNEEDPLRTIECRECHMPLQASNDPAAGDDADANRSPDDGKHRGHRFLGANQFLPTLMELEGGEEQVALVHKWLRGEVEVPEIADKWTEGPAVPIEIEAPDTVAAGDSFDILVHIVNNKVGHDFPTGPLDIIQAWVELEVTDSAGRTVFESGKIDENNFIQTGSFMFKAEPVDRYGNLIDRHNLWEMVGVRFKRSLFPGSEELAAYSVDCSGVANLNPEDPGILAGQEARVDVPADSPEELTIVAKLKYRKFDQYLLNFAFGEDSGLRSPVTELSSATATVQVLSGTH